MREVIIPFLSRVEGADGLAYRVRMIGHERADGIWEGHIEFTREEMRLVTGIETTQLTSRAIEEWATSLGTIYLERALRRARPPGTRRNAAQSQGRERRL